MFNGQAMIYRHNRIIAAVPAGLLTVPLAVLPLVRAVIATRDEQRRKASVLGCCRNCGYDLRASADRCPECGAPIKVLA